MEIILVIITICVLSHLLRPFEWTWWSKPIIHGAVIIFALYMVRRDKLRKEAEMEHGQLDDEQTQTKRIYEDKEEIKCPFCGSPIVVENGATIEDLVCGECGCVPGDYDHTNGTRPLGASL